MTCDAHTSPSDPNRFVVPLDGFDDGTDQDDGRPWSNVENTILCEHWTSAESSWILAWLLGRSPLAIAIQASRLGLPPRKKPPGTYHPWTPDDLAVLDGAWKAVEAGELAKLDPVAIAKALNRSIDSVIRALHRRWGSEAIDRIDKKACLAYAFPHAVRQDAIVLDVNTRAITKSWPKRLECLCCGKPFLSQGPHNRLCQACR